MYTEVVKTTIQLLEMDYYYNEYFNPIVEGVNLNLDASWKLGLIGRGKTTLLNLINKTLEPSKGKVIVPMKTELFPYAHDSDGSALKVIRNCIAPFDKWANELKQMEANLTEDNLEGYGDL